MFSVMRRQRRLNQPSAYLLSSSFFSVEIRILEADPKRMVQFFAPFNYRISAPKRRLDKAIKLHNQALHRLPTCRKPGTGPWPSGLRPGDASAPARSRAGLPGRPARTWDDLLALDGIGTRISRPASGRRDFPECAAQPRWWRLHRRPAANEPQNCLPPRVRRPVQMMISVRSGPGGRRPRPRP